MRTLILYSLIFSSILSLILSSRVIADPYYTIQESGTNNTLRSITFINDNTGFAAGNLSTLLRTSNGGTNWIDVNISSSSTPYNCVLFPNSTTGFVVSDAGELIKSTNGGLNWQITVFSGNALKYVYFLNESTGFVSGDNGTLFKTTNTGGNWSDISLSITEPITKVAFSDQDYGYFLTRQFLNEGYVYKTTNGGMNWQVLSNFYSGYTGDRALFDCIPLNRDTVYISLGYYQTGIMRTVNGGQNWQYIYNHFQSALFPGSFFELFYRDGYIYAFNGPTDGATCYIVKSSNGGYNFTHPSSYRLLGYMYDVFYFKNSPVGYVCGESGLIVKLHSYVTGVNNISTTVPDKFMLKQNYPNPFNPSTKIAFDLPEPVEGNVQLKVYDILGIEIAVLINEHLSPGSYEFNFTANDLSCGVYFYTLTAGSFSETKRMLLIK